MRPLPPNEQVRSSSVGLNSTTRTIMFPFFAPKSPTPEEVQREQIAAGAKELKDYLNSLTPEARAKFWADIEGKGADQEKQTPPSN